MQWIIGDVHGCIHTLNELLYRIVSQDASPSFFFVGDYIDRGYFSKDVISRIILLREQYPVRTCCGNHDEILKMLLGQYTVTPWENYARSSQPEHIVDWAVVHGFGKTVKSYYPKINDFIGPMTTKIQNDFATDFPGHYDFLLNLEYYVETPEFFVTHASFPDVSNLSQLNHISRWLMIWERNKGFNAIEDEKQFQIRGKPWFVGHTPTCNLKPWSGTDGEVIDEYKSIKFIDTGSFLRGCKGGISAYCWEEKRSIFVRTIAKDIGE